MACEGAPHIPLIQQDRVRYVVVSHVPETLRPITGVQFVETMDQSLRSFCSALLNSVTSGCEQCGDATDNKWSLASSRREVGWIALDLAVDSPFIQRVLRSGASGS